MKEWWVVIGENQCDTDSETVLASSREEAWDMVEKSLQGTYYHVIDVVEALEFPSGKGFITGSVTGQAKLP